MPRHRDGLLTAARALLTFIMAMLGVLLVGLLFAAPALLIFRDTVMAELAKEHGPIAQPALVLLALEALFALSFAMAVPAVGAARHLRKIIDSVGEGDPFVPENARRLRAMGWLSLVIQAVTIPAASVAKWLEHEIKGAHFGFGVSLSALLLTLLLFVLARVFERGTALRDDLEGTV